MKKKDVPLPRKKSTVYVMRNLCDRNEVRIGHHTTTNTKRERQVSNIGRKENWKVVACFLVESKPIATAVEHVAHALLEKLTIRRKSIGNLGNFRIVYHCSPQEARQAIETAMSLLSKKLEIKAIEREDDPCKKLPPLARAILYLVSACQSPFTRAVKSDHCSTRKARISRTDFGNQLRP